MKFRIFISSLEKQQSDDVEIVRNEYGKHNKRTRVQAIDPYKKQTGTMRNRFLNPKVVNSWNELDEKTVAVDTVEKFNRKLGEFVIPRKYRGMHFILQQLTGHSIPRHLIPQL